MNWSVHVNTILGLDQAPERFSFDSFLKLVHLEDRDIVLHAVERAIKTGEAYSCDHRIIRPDGEERIFHEHAEVILDTHENPVRMTGIVQYLSEHVRAEETIRRHIYYDELTDLPNRHLFEDDSGDKSLLLHAESAMYTAKENGGNRFCF